MDEEEMELEEEVKKRVAAGPSGKNVEKRKIVEEVPMSDDEVKIEEESDIDDDDDSDADDSDAGGGEDDDSDDDEWMNHDWSC